MQKESEAKLGKTLTSAVEFGPIAPLRRMSHSGHHLVHLMNFTHTLRLEHVDNLAFLQRLVENWNPSEAHGEVIAAESNKIPNAVQLTFSGTVEGVPVIVESPCCDNLFLQHRALATGLSVFTHRFFDKVLRQGAGSTGIPQDRQLAA